MKETYSKYKSSGLEWIGDIPKHWQYIGLKNVLNLLTDFESNGSFASVKENVKVEDYGEVWYVRMTDLENGNIRNEKCKYCDLNTHTFLSKTILYGGELLITKRGEIGKVYLFPEDSGLSTLGPNAYLLRLEKAKVHSNYLYYFYRSEGGQITLKLMDNSTTIGSLYKDDVKSSRIILPPLHEQQQIVNYLDQKTKETDNLIAITENKIELLKESRTAIINQVITKGLDPDVEMKDSGVEWIGEIPKHWVKSKVKWSLTFLNSRRIPIEAEERDGRRGDYPYYGASGIIDYVDDYIFDGENILVGEDGANIISRSSRLSFIATGKYWVNNHAHILSVNTGSVLYFCEQLELNDFTCSASGSAQPKLTKEALGNIEIVVPPNEEQFQIADYILVKTLEIDNLISIEQQRINTLKEYRQSLISEVVTGKVRVCEDLKQ